jgi:hypothetical protein
MYRQAAPLFVGGRACFKAGLNEFANGADINGAAGFKTG